MKQMKMNWTGEDAWYGRVTLDNWIQAATGSASARALPLPYPAFAARTHTYANNFRGCVELLLQAERLLFFAEPVPIGTWEELARVVAPRVGGKGSALDREVAGGTLEAYLADTYLAATFAVRRLYSGAHRVSGASVLTLPPPETEGVELGVIPWVAYPIILIGIAAVAGGTWWGVDRNAKQAQVSMNAATLAAEVDIYIRDLQARIAAKLPLPDPPRSVIAAATAERTGYLWVLGAGLGLGGAAVYGVVKGLKAPAPRRMSNPVRRRLRSPKRAAKKVPARRTAKKTTTRRAAKKTTTRRAAKKAPTRRVAKKAPARRTAKKTATKRNPKRKAKKTATRRAAKRKPKSVTRTSTTRTTTKKTTTKRNPLARGYSRATVSRNVGMLRSEGMPAGQAVAASLSSARKAWQKKYGKRRALPQHLKTKAQKAKAEKGKRSPKAKRGARRRK
jgi:hypothetical protein